jgi:hypothetical protein
VGFIQWIWASIDVYFDFLVLKNPEVSNPFSVLFTDSNPRKTEKGVQKKSKDTSVAAQIQ